MIETATRQRRSGQVEFGVHLPQIEWEPGMISLDRIIDVAKAAERLGFSTLTANDHLVYRTPWLDAPVALAATLTAAPTLKLMTSVSLPVIRGPVATAKTLGMIDLLSGGRLEAGLGPGSSEADYHAAGIPFDERWPRFEESVAAIRSLWDADAPPFVGSFYDTTGVTLAPPPAQPKGPPIWIGSWGSQAGMRRVARLADGWLASGYNTTPESFRETWAQLGDMLTASGRDPSGFPCTLATNWMYITDDEAEARAMRERISGMTRRPIEEVADRLPIGSAAQGADLFGRYKGAGMERVLLWPIGDDIEQLERFAGDVMPQL
jgi:probable F420-dependent oxidoreductase